MSSLLVLIFKNTDCWNSWASQWRKSSQKTVIKSKKNIKKDFISIILLRYIVDNNWLEISTILERRIEKSACSFKDPPFSSPYSFGFNETEHWKQKKDGYWLHTGKWSSPGLLFHVIFYLASGSMSTCGTCNYNE